jgi:hypothetical protein
MDDHKQRLAPSRAAIPCETPSRIGVSACTSAASYPGARPSSTKARQRIAAG